MKKSGVWMAGILAFLLVGPGLSAPAGRPSRPERQKDSPLWGPSATSSPQVAQAAAKPLQYEVNVVLKLINVHVTDKKGNPVRDLAKEDFTVTDNGQPVTLTDFERHALEPAPAPADAEEAPKAVAAESRTRAPAVRPASRKFFLFFDFAYNNVRGILKAQKAALHFVDTVVSPGDEVAVLTYATIGGLAFHEYLTADHAKVRKVLEAIGHKNIAGRATQIEDQYWRLVQETPGSEPGAAMGLNFRAEAEANRQESKSMAQKYMGKLTDLARALRLVEGEKHVIFFSTGVPNSLIYGYTPDNARYRSDTRTVAGDDVLRRLNEAMYREFSAAGCSFYAFDTREYAKETSLFTYDEQTFAMGSRGMSVAIDPTSIFKDDKASGLNSLKRITDITGGKYYSNINMFEKNLDQVQAMTGTYYVLGYAINERWDGQFHDVKVEVKRRGCEVRAQTGYFNPKPFREYTDFEKQLHLFDLALNEKAFSRLPINVPMIALSYAVEGATRLGTLARVPRDVAAKLTGTRLEVVTIFFDSQGEIAGLVRQEADPASLRGHDTAFAAGAALKPGDYSCRLVIRDMGSGMSAVASAKATVGRPAAERLQLGTPLLLAAGGGSPWREAVGRKAGEKALLSDAYPYDGSLASPVLAELPQNATSVLVVIPCAVPGGGQPDLALSARLVDAASGGERPVIAAVSGQTRKGPLQIMTLELITADIPPGKYYLHVYAEDRVSGSLGHTFTTLVIPAR